MSEPQVDFSAIRGDWYFHMNFLTNSMSHTLKRVGHLRQKLSSELEGEEIAGLVDQQAEAWAALTQDVDAKGAIKVAEPALQAFVDLCRSSKEPCDALEVARGLGGSSSIYDNTLEQFTEACRQARGLCDDFEMMREQRPDS